MLKRLFDLSFSLILIVVLSPLMLAIALYVRITMGSQIFFRQVRPGFREKPFVLIKFRTMTDELDQNGNLLDDELRMTAFGRFLRASSLDELPELWNVITGKMSLVGPRPLLTEYLELYSIEERRRHDVRPGITGLAQINGRNAISWNEKFKLDLWYVDNRSFLLDLKILIITLFKVIMRDGVSPSGSAVMPRFGGRLGDDDLK